MAMVSPSNYLRIKKEEEVQPSMTSSMPSVVGCCCILGSILKGPSSHRRRTGHLHLCLAQFDMQSAVIDRGE